MNEVVDGQSKIPIWFWIVGVIALLWNLMGLLAFVGQVMMTDEAMAELPAAQQELYKTMPTWATICFAIAVIGGVVASILLLKRHRLAIPAFVLSLLGVLGQMTYMIFLSNTVAIMGAPAVVMPIMLIAICCGLVMFAIFARKKSWFNYNK